MQRKITLNEFELIDEIGEGKYGKVYMAQHKETGFLCALKTVSKVKIKEEDIEEPFIREIKIQMYLNHPHIVKLYGFFADEDNIYLIMECCISGHLLSVMKQKKIFEEPEIIETISNIFEAVSFIHCHGVIHRDLKPENIVIQNVILYLFRECINFAILDGLPMPRETAGQLSVVLPCMFAQKFSKERNMMRKLMFGDWESSLMS